MLTLWCKHYVLDLSGHKSVQNFREVEYQLAKKTIIYAEKGGIRENNTPFWIFPLIRASLPTCLTTAYDVQSTLEVQDLPVSVGTGLVKFCLMIMLSVLQSTDFLACCFDEADSSIGVPEDVDRDGGWYGTTLQHLL